MSNSISNSETIIDSRDVIARIEELEARNQPHWVAGWNIPGYMPDNEPALFDNAEDALEYIKSTIRDCDQEQARHHDCEEFADSLKADVNGELGVNYADFHYFITKDTDGGNYLDLDECEELAALKDLAKQAESSPDWIHGETLIRRSCFEQYIADLIDDCYDLPAQLKSGEWPYRHIQIDIEAAAQEAEQDYIEVTFDGVEYLIRA